MLITNPLPHPMLMLTSLTPIMLYDKVPPSPVKDVPDPTPIGMQMPNSKRSTVVQKSVKREQPANTIAKTETGQNMRYVFLGRAFGQSRDDK